ncbi:MAG: guanylate kinase [bacterium]|nr:guanylate kinase [bacterium]
MLCPPSSRAFARGVRLITGPGLLFVVSGPSGAGKDTLVEALRAHLPRLRYSVSATTRAPRPGECEGEHYFFLTREAFEARRAHDGFLEWREYNGQLYGTPRDYVERTLAEGYDLIVKPEVHGALAIKSAYPDAVLIFLVPDRFSHLRERLLARRTETNEEIARRLEIAREEMRFIRNFDYLVINEQGNSETAMRDLGAILHAERFRIHRFGDESLGTIVRT